jgi:glycosyltransferase involved in cell wall biosynthesis
MNILQINGRLSRGGGPQTYMQQATNLFRSHGHQVSYFGMWDEDNSGDVDAPHYVSPVNPLQVARSGRIGMQIDGALRALWSREAAAKLNALLAARPVDVAHIHNIRYELSPSILPRLKNRGIRVVQTVHDYALLCPRGGFYSETSGVCERCRVHRYYVAPLTRCIKGSLSRSLFAAAELAVHRALRVHIRYIDLFIVPSRFMEQKYLEYGLPSQKVLFLRNTVRVEDFAAHQQLQDGGYYAYVGALRELKGVRSLLDAAERLPSLPLLIIGAGEDREYLERTIAERHLTHVKVVGHLSGNHLREAVARARFTVLPSECYENCPMVVLEAFALGRPVIGARIGGIPEMVEDRATGLLFESGNVADLADRISYLFDRPELARALGAEGLRRVEQDYSAEAHYQGLLEAYQSAAQVTLV